MEYVDGTSHHCEAGLIAGKGEMARDREPLMSAEMPDSDRNQDNVDGDEPRGPTEARTYRAIEVRFYYFASDRIDK